MSPLCPSHTPHNNFCKMLVSLRTPLSLSMGPTKLVSGTFSFPKSFNICRRAWERGKYLALMTHALVNIDFVYISMEGIMLHLHTCPQFLQLQTHLFPNSSSSPSNQEPLPSFFSSKEAEGFKSYDTAPYSMLNSIRTLTDTASILPNSSSLPFPACFPSHTMFSFILLILFI